jgi:ferredoxin-NADP reductase
MAMLRHRAHAAAAVRDTIPVRLLYSVRMLDDIIYREELDQLAKCPEVGVTYTVTREAPTDWQGYRRRIDRAMLEEVGWPATALPQVFVCGPTPLVESVATLLVELRHNPGRVRTERFGPTG